MENILTRYRNVTILVAVLFVQVLGLAVQVKRTTADKDSARLLRIWVVGAVTPLEKALLWSEQGARNLWRGYFYLRGVRAENRELKQEIERLRLEQVRLNEAAAQGRRLQALLAFKESFISRTVAAQVIGSSGSELSKAVYIDKGARDGLRNDMAVITSEGVVGKVLRVFDSSALVLLINDQTSGVGAILEKSRLQGVLRGTPAGEVVLEKVMSDEQVQPGERVVTSGGDRIFPKGLAVGSVIRASPGAELFLNIRVKPAADLGRLEEVLVITKTEEKAVSPVETAGPVRAVDILAARLPGVPEKPANQANQPAATGTSVTSTPGTAPPDKSTPGVAKPANVQKPASATVKAKDQSAQPAAVPGPPASTATAPPEDKPH